MSTQERRRRWFHLTPARFFIGLLVVQVFLFFSERFQWFPLNEHKGWTVLIAIGVICVAVVVMLVWGLVCVVLRRRFQFSFRSLLVFLLAVSVPLGWFAWEMQRARRQREAVEQIVKANWVVLYDYQHGGFFGGDEPITPAWLRKLLGDDFFCDVAHVSSLFCQDTNADLKLLERMTKLKTLNLGVRMIGSAKVTDDDLVHLRELNDLEKLWLSYTPVTDSGLEHLRGLTSLEVLELYGTDVTDQGVKRLQEALPHCEIHH